MGFCSSVGSGGGETVVGGSKLEVVVVVRIVWSCVNGELYSLSHLS